MGRDDPSIVVGWHLRACCWFPVARDTAEERRVNRVGNMIPFDESEGVGGTCGRDGVFRPGTALFRVGGFESHLHFWRRKDDNIDHRYLR